MRWKIAWTWLLIKLRPPMNNLKRNLSWSLQMLLTSLRIGVSKNNRLRTGWKVILSYRTLWSSRDSTSWIKYLLTFRIETKWGIKNRKFRPKSHREKMFQSRHKTSLPGLKSFKFLRMYTWKKAPKTSASSSSNPALWLLQAPYSTLTWPSLRTLPWNSWPSRSTKFLPLMANRRKKKSKLSIQSS